MKHLHLFSLAVLWAISSQAAPYTLERVAFPDDIPPEVGAIEFDSAGTLYVALRRGDILVTTPTEDPAGFQWRHFASGFHNPCGIHIVGPGHIIIGQMAELTEVIDTDSDGVADEYTNLSTDFGLSGNYHETMDICPDGEGGIYLAPGTASHNGPTFATPRGPYSKLGRHGRNYSAVQWRGWVIHRAADGSITPVSSGYRMPNGIERDPHGNIWCSDNQGDWRAATPIYHVQPDTFAGHPSALVWDARMESFGDPLYQPRILLDDLWNKPAFQVPHQVVRSAAEPAFIPQQGSFGPFGGHMLIPDQSGERIIRCVPEMVDGAYQGAAFPFLDKADGLSRGNNRLAFSPDGKTLYIGQTGRGWGSLSEGIQRAQFNGEVNFAPVTCSLTRSGFALSFTEPVSAKISTEQFAIERYRYKYSHTYGSPEQDKVNPKILSVTIDDEDPRNVHLAIAQDELLPNYNYRIDLKKVDSASGTSLENESVYYTLNRLRRPDPNSVVTIREAGDDILRVEIEGRHFTDYHLRGFSNPILYPIHNPDGTGMTRDWPIVEDGRKGEQHDHLHHKSLFIGHQGVNGADFWHEKPHKKAGTIEHLRLIETRSGQDRALLRTLNLWKDADGEPVCSDTRELQFGTVGDKRARYIDLELNIHASHGDLVFQEFKDGFIGIRTHPHLRLTANPKQGVPEVYGKAENSSGTNGEGIWGEKANWVHYWGQVEGKPAGIAFLAHPHNPRSPTWWHARSYGLIAANPFGPKKSGGDGQLRLPAGQTLTLRYRLLFHSDAYKAADIAGQFAAYAAEPLVPRTVVAPIPAAVAVSRTELSAEPIVPRGGTVIKATRNGEEEIEIRSNSFDKGARIFADRDFHFTSVPETLRGGDFILTRNDDKKHNREVSYQVEVDGPSRMALLIDTRIDLATMPWVKESGFERTDLEVKTNAGFSYRVYARDLDAGTLVELGNQQGGSFYSIVVTNWE